MYDTNRAALVICLVIAAVAVINLAMFAMLRRSRSGGVGQIELLRRAAHRARHPWQDEDDALQELSRRVTELKENQTDDQKT